MYSCENDEVTKVIRDLRMKIENLGVKVGIVPNRYNIVINKEDEDDWEIFIEGMTVTFKIKDLV